MSHRKESSVEDPPEQFVLPCAREEHISPVKMLFATRQNLQTNSKDALLLQSHDDRTSRCFECGNNPGCEPDKDGDCDRRKSE